jgi:hypothetical protein
MRRASLFAIIAAFGLTAPEPAFADAKESDDCLRTKIWSGYNDGWAVRTATSAEMAAGEHRIYLVTLYAGNEYQLRVCGDASAADIDIILHDANGQEVARDQSDDREPMVAFTPTNTDTYYVAIYTAELVKEAKKATVSMAVTYR